MMRNWKSEGALELSILILMRPDWRATLFTLTVESLRFDRHCRDWPQRVL